ncbi:proteasome regulatory subunit 12 [Rhizoctonia solani AG-1 IA]|uniref:Proteasome regulatory subunit 12 n=1 Tax=Thanatephorus cucumeris (strain AG1-IA) TaxID=983506 RepID=L8WFQ0_THACA|nr:proteasome regulatory subunit 12 [Rhizoctonia solani AG-1 IA]
MIAKSLFAVLPLVGLARAIFHKSVWGMNVTQTNSPQYGRDNRAVAPLRQLSFNQWWFHGHLDQPPHPEDIMELPAGGKVTTEISCDIGATSLWPWGPGGDHQAGNNPCPNSFTEHIHNDLGGCALAIAYKSEASEVKPEDFVVFSVNHRCVWDRFTDFQSKQNQESILFRTEQLLTEIHQSRPTCLSAPTASVFAAGTGNTGKMLVEMRVVYMNNFQCKITGATSNTPIPQGQVPVRCVGDPSKCVKGAKQPFYWDQAEGNNNIYTPPLYLDSYGFADGAQNDIWDTVGGASPIASKSADLASTSVETPASTATSISTTAVVTDSSSTPVPEATTTPQEPDAPTAASSSEAPATSTPAQTQAAEPSTPASSELPASAPAPEPTSAPASAPTSAPAPEPTSAPASAPEITSVEAPTSTSPSALTSSAPTSTQGQRTCGLLKDHRSLGVFPTFPGDIFIAYITRALAGRLAPQTRVASHLFSVSPTLTSINYAYYILGAVLLSVADHHARSAARAPNKRVVGVLLGQDNGKTVNVANSFAIPFEEDEKDSKTWFLDHNYIEGMWDMFKKVNGEYARERMIGWYHSGPKLRASDQEINDLFKQFIPRPVMVIVNVRQMDESIPTDAYFAVEKIKDDGTETQKTFFHVPSAIEAEEAEEIGVEHLLRDIKDSTTTTLATRVSNQLASLRGLSARLREISAYLKRASQPPGESGALPPNHQISYQLQDALSLLPDLDNPDTTRSFTTATNDQLLVVYLSSLVRAVIALHALVDNKAANGRAELEEGKEKTKEEKKEEVKKDETKVEKEGGAAEGGKRA